MFKQKDKDLVYLRTQFSIILTLLTEQFTKIIKSFK